MFPFFQSPGTSSDCHDFSSIMESDLTTTSVNYLRTLRYILQGPIDLCMFRFLRWSWTWSSLTVGDSPSPCLVVHPLKRYGKRDCHSRQRQKICWVPQPSPCPLLPVFQSCSLCVGVHFLWPSFSGWHTCRSPSYYSLHPLPSPAPAAPWPSWVHPYTTGQSPYTLPRVSVPASTACAFPPYPLVWPAALDSAMLVSSLPFLTSYTWGLRAPPLYGKCP